MLRNRFVLFFVLLILSLPAFAKSNSSPYLGRWDITATTPNGKYIYWLEVKEENGAMTGSFLHRAGSVYKLTSVSVENGELVFDSSQGNRKQLHRAKLENNKLIGTLTMTNTQTNKSETLNWVGVRAPKWGKADANAKHTFGKAVELFDGNSVDATWTVQHQGKQSGWTVVDGIMTNQAGANNLVSKQSFKDFKIHCEYKLEEKSNSGIYLRGRYELQVLDDYGKAAEQHGHMSIYSRIAPKVNASKPAGEWQVMEAIIVGNRVTVLLNGQKVHDNQEIEGLTGGALDSDEAQPGPIMLQGDHGKVWFRKVTVTPIGK